MECPNCNGKGWVDNPRYYDNDPCYSWSHGIKPSKKCSRCKGYGYIIGNIKDIVSRLKCTMNGVIITPEEAKQMYESITN